MTSEQAQSPASSGIAQNRVLRAASELFSSQGIPATTIQHIAERANLPTSTVEEQFGSKDLVFKRLADDFCNAARKDIHQMNFDCLCLVGALGVLAEFLTNLHRQSPLLFKTMAGQASIDATFMGGMRDVRGDAVEHALDGFGALLVMHDVSKRRDALEGVVQMMLGILTHSVVFGSGPVHFQDDDCCARLASMAHSILSQEPQAMP